MITYSSTIKITPAEFIDVLQRSTLAERRPVGSPERIQKMLEHANILITAWDEGLLVGVSRALSDLAFCCYLSDLAVDKAYQKKGIGKLLLQKTKEAAGDDTTLVLLAAPAAQDYYPKTGMTRFDHCFVIYRKTTN